MRRLKWLGGQDDANLGEGITFVVSKVRVRGAERDGARCGDEPCAGFTFTDNSDDCAQAVRPGEKDGSLTLYGRVRCTVSQQKCSDFRSRLSAQSISIPAAETGGGENENGENDSGEQNGGEENGGEENGGEENGGEENGGEENGGGEGDGNGSDGEDGGSNGEDGSDGENGGSNGENGGNGGEGRGADGIDPA